jgi:hypothetical protein
MIYGQDDCSETKNRMKDKMILGQDDCSGTKKGCVGEYDCFGKKEIILSQKSSCPKNHPVQ